MERHREARKGTMVSSSSSAAAAANGSGVGLSRRRQRNSSSFRDSPEEDGRMEIPETSRLRDRGAKKDRDRDRSNRSRRRRGERLLHGSNRDRDEGDESSEESMDQDEEDEDEDMSVPVRLPPSSPPMPNPAAASSPQQNHQHSNHQQHQQPSRKSFLPKAVKWKADEMIGVPVPRKARSASTKRAHEPPVTGGGGGAGGGEHITHQASASPSRLSPASAAAQLSPSSSNGSLRKKMFPKSTSLYQDEIEIEVAEVLFGMTRQFGSLPKQDGHKLDSRDTDGGSGTEAKSRVSSPSSMSPSPAAHASALPSSITCSNSAPSPTIAPKRKRPRHVKLDEENHTNPVVLYNISSLFSPAAKVESEIQIKAKNSATPTGLTDVLQQENKIQELLPSTGGSSITGDRVEDKEELPPERVDLDVNLRETTAKKILPQRIREEKFKFDLMALPGKLSPERDEFNAFDPDTEMAPEVSKDKVEEKTAEIAILKDERRIEKSGEKDTDLKKQAVTKQIPELQLDLKKPKKEDVGFDKMQAPKQQAKDLKTEPKQEKSGSASSHHMPLAVGTWPGAFPPPYGYMSQVPSLQIVAPINGTAGSSSLLQPPAFLQSHPRPNRCATHCFVAQMISNYQKFARMNCFWTAAAGATPFYAAKPYNQNMVPPSENSLSGNQMQGGFLGTIAGAMQDTKGTPVAPSYTSSNASQEKILQANSMIVETAQRKQLILQQLPQSGSASNIPHGPAFIFPINQQQQLLQPAAGTSGAGRAGAAKSTTIAGVEVQPSSAIGSPVGSSGACGLPTPVNLNFVNMPANDAQYVAFLQNNGYPFPIPSQFTGPPFRGTNNAQAMPFFYPSHLLHPQQLQPQQQASQLPHAQQSHQNSSTLNGPTQKHSQQSIDGFPASIQQQDLLPQQARPKERSKGVDANLHSADASVRVGNAGGHSYKQHQQAQQKQNMKVELLPQAFTIPFASFGGAVNAPPGFDFSMSQNHAILQSLPETFRHGYYQMASAAAAQATEPNIDHVSEDGQAVAKESLNTNINDKEDRKSVAVSKGAQRSSLSVAKADDEPASTSVLSNGIIDMSSRPVNPIQPLASTSRDRSAGTMPASTSLTAATIVGNSHQQQQHLIPLPKHQHQQMQMQQHLASSRSKPSVSGNIVRVHPESLSGGSTITKFAHGLTFPQTLIQGGSPLQWPQGKPSAGRGGVDPVGASPAPVVKNSFLQLQGRASQQSLPSQAQAQAHQTRISFGINGNKQGGQHHSAACSSPSPSSATGIVGSPSNSISKSVSSSPRASTNVKPSLQASAILLPQQANVKHSTSSSSSKSNMSNPNMPPVLGHHPQKLPAPSSITRQQQQPQQLKQQQPSEAQLFFLNPHLQQVQCAQSNASAAQYYQKRPAEHTRQTPQQQHYNSAPSTSSMLSLCAPSALTLAGVPTASDPTKAVAVNSLAAANNLKGLSPTSFLNAAQLAVAAQSASASPRLPISATFSYMSLPPFSVKPSAEQKPTAGTDNLDTCWQPEKR